MRTSVPDAIVAAHPDDEILGLGVLLPTLNRQFTVIHITDGAPRSGDDARRAGCAGWREYADLRRHEFHRALAAAGGTEGMLVRLNCPDQEASFHIAEHARELAALFDELRPSTVFTHAYEGGHPDHDATAAAVHAAAHLADVRPVLVEFAGYHAGGESMICERFLDERNDFWPRLTAAEHEWKRHLLDCYPSQARVLTQFPLQYEPLRKAPRYDFAQPPHRGRLYYQRFSWAIEPSGWCDMARQSFQRLGVPCVC